MYSNYNKYRVLQALFDKPTTGLHLREISREAKLAPHSTKKYLQELEEEHIILSREERYGYPLYYANMDNSKYKLLRQQNVTLRLEESGLLDELDNYGPETIVLFGSASRGEDGESSDIDLYIIGKDHGIDLTTHEENLQRKINILFSKSFENAANEFKNNIVNARVLRGYLQAYPHEPLPKRHSRQSTRAKAHPSSRRNTRSISAHR